MIEYARFPSRFGFPLGPETRYNSSLQNAIGPAKFRAYIQRTEIGGVVWSVSTRDGNAGLPDA
jgi:hypothetical protein